MYGYEWTAKNGIYRLIINSKVMSFPAASGGVSVSPVERRGGSFCKEIYHMGGLLPIFVSATDSNRRKRRGIKPQVRIKEIRPVFKQELDYFGFNEHWKYPDTDAPLLWAEGIRRYIHNGECVAVAKGGGFYSKPGITIRKSRGLSP